MMRPFTDRDGESGQELFNGMYKSARVIVEKAIGGWKQKCPLLNIGVDGKQREELGVTVRGSAVLNGFCKRAEEKVLNPSPPEYLKGVFMRANKQTNKQNVNGKPAGLFLPEGPAPFARTPLLSKRP